MPTQSPDPLFDLTDQVIVITGGAGVLPGAMARALAARGARVALLNRTETKAQQLANEINSAGGHALAVAGDVTDRESLQAASAKILAMFGKIDHLINGAGG